MPFSLGLHPLFQVSSLGNAALEGLRGPALSHHTMAAAHHLSSCERPAQGRRLCLAGPTAAVRLVDRGSGAAAGAGARGPMRSGGGVDRSARADGVPGALDGAAQRLAPAVRALPVAAARPQSS
jgi:hypothetical protein